jgi:hypothetical protein
MPLTEHENQVVVNISMYLNDNALAHRAPGGETLRTAVEKLEKAAPERRGGPDRTGEQRGAGLPSRFRVSHI